MCRIDLCGQIGVKISSYGDTQFIKINPLNCPMGQFIRREDMDVWPIYYNDWTAVNRNVANKYKYRQDTIYNIITKKYEYNRSSKQ